MTQSVPNACSRRRGRTLLVRTAAICLVATVFLSWNRGLASASSDPNSAQSTSGYPSGCKTVSFTGDGGFYDNANFYWQPSDTVTLTTHWCYANDVITSHSVTYTTTIPNSLSPRLSLGSMLYKLGRVLGVSIGGDYTAGVTNNVGFILIVGDVNASGHHHFVNEPNAGG
jgi:hypothetical protein